MTVSEGDEMLFQFFASDDDVEKPVTYTLDGPSEVGLVALFTLFCSQNTVQLMTAKLAGWCQKARLRRIVTPSVPRGIDEGAPLNTPAGV
jgi:hypothetical protein